MLLSGRGQGAKLDGHNQVLTAEERGDGVPCTDWLTGAGEWCQEQQPTDGLQDHGGGLAQAAEPQQRGPRRGSAQLRGSEARAWQSPPPSAEASLPESPGLSPCLLMASISLSLCISQ